MASSVAVVAVMAAELMDASVVARAPVGLFDEKKLEIAAVVAQFDQNSKSNKRCKIADYVESVVPLYTLDDFKSHFRLNKDTVMDVVSVIEESVAQMPSCDRPKVSREKLTLLSVWFLANQETFRQVADRFNVGKGHAHRCYRYFLNTFSSKINSYIKWPTTDDRCQVLQGFQQLRKKPFPGTFAAVDGCHIPVKCPVTDKASYYNRKGFHSVLLQGICTSDCRFIDIFVGWPGSAHDARVWQHSPIFNKLATSVQALLPENSHILGDSAYPCSLFLMYPYRDNGYLTQNQKRFNVRLSSSRVVIEQAFGMLKGRFRRLKYLDMKDLSLAARVITVACVLHNLCIEHDDDIETDSNMHDDDDCICVDNSVS